MTLRRPECGDIDLVLLPQPGLASWWYGQRPRKPENSLRNFRRFTSAKSHLKAQNIHIPKFCPSRTNQREQANKRGD